jgi:diacylglycerol kinase (ATP)
MCESKDSVAKRRFEAPLFHSPRTAQTRASMVVIFNPAAGRRRATLLWRVLDVLSANGMRLELAETGRAGHAADLARGAAASGTRLVVAAGGDGTIAEVASGILGTGARLGVIPLGTANVLAQELGLPFSPRAIAAALAFGRTRRILPGIARGPGGSRVFVQMLGLGFDAHVVHHLSVPLKHAIGRSAYVLQGMRELVRYGFGPITMRVDGETITTASAIVSKGRLYGGSYRLTADADSAAPGFSVVTFGQSGPGAALMYGTALQLNLLPRAPGVRVRRASCVEVPGAPLLPVQADGDPAGHGPLSITDADAPIDIVTG